MKKIFLFLILLGFLQSCSLLNYFPFLNFRNCNRYKNNDYSFMATASEKNINQQLSYNKAYDVARTKLLKDIDDYVVSKISYDDYLKDSEYEEKLNNIKNNIVDEIVVVCDVPIKRRNYYQHE